MNWIKKLGRRLRGLPKDEQGDEGVNKMLILLLVTVPIILVLVLFGGKIIDEFQVGLCNLGIVDPPEWHVQDAIGGSTGGAGGTGGAGDRESREWEASDCAMYREDVPEGEEE